MFTWLKGQFQDMRIAVAFPAYEKSMRTEHAVTAARRFSTAYLEREVAHCMKIPRQEMQARFSGPIENFRSNIARLSNELIVCTKNLTVLERPYKEELGPLYEEIKELGERKSTLHSQKSEGHASLNQAQSDINAWHAESKGSFFGNGGKALPSHSFFGQSFGDLDGYKSDRGAAVQEIERCSAEIDNIKNRRDRVGDEISAIKADRQRMFDLRGQGIHPDKLKRTARDIEKRRGELNGMLTKTEREQADFLEAARYRTGTISLESEIARIRSRRDEFLRSFDQEQAQDARKNAHRVAWLNKHA